ncbi:MAG: hypothetical protein JW750_07900 [Anaerolineaceae bacterium]|nr:hypothetical protein [Anaerolineaceae bacterium]
MSKRKKNRTRPEAPAKTAQEIAIQRVKALLPPEEFSTLEQELAQPLRGAIRLNPLKLSGDLNQHADRLAQRYGWTMEPVPYCDHAWWLTGAEDNPPGRTWEHRLGHYYVQDAASMMPVELFDFEEGEDPLILDMASSPGGKATHLLAKIKDRGLVLANDASSDRITALRLVLQNWGGVNQAICQFPGEKFGQWFSETFDKILLDAPCSMQNLRSTETHPMRPISEREQLNLGRRQARMLESALHAARVGGQIVYATCTLMPEEDEAVLDWLLKAYPGQFQIEDMNRKLPSPAPGLTRAEQQVFDPAVERAVRIWPHRFSTSGFFTARLTKLAPTHSKQTDTPIADFARAEFFPASDTEIQNLLQFYREEFDFPLDDVIHENQLTLWRRQDQIIAMPQRYFDRLQHLPLRGIGLTIAQQTPRGWEPDHDWVTRFFNHFHSNFYTLSPDQQTAWTRGEDLHIQTSYAKGKILLLRSDDDPFLGMGRQMKQRIKNLLPKRMIL